MSTGQDRASMAQATPPPAYSSPLVSNEPSDDKIVTISPQIEDESLPEVVVPAVVPEWKMKDGATVASRPTLVSEPSKTTLSTETSEHRASTPGAPSSGTPPLEVPGTRLSASYINEVTVTPLHLLGDQSDTVDCPFCRRRTETRVKMTASGATHAAAAGLFLTTIGGVGIPYKRNWKSNVTHYCTNCDRKVAYRHYKEQKMTPLGTPEHLREVSRFPAVNGEPS